MHEVIPPQVQDLFCLGSFAEPHNIPVCSFLHIFKGFKDFKDCLLNQTYQTKESAELKTSFLNCRPKVPWQASNWMFGISGALLLVSLDYQNK